MNTQLIPFQFQSLPLRVVADGHGNPWFVGKDVCDILGYANHNDAIKTHCKPKGVANRYPLETAGGVQYPVCIDEGNLYRLIIKSNKPEAEPFEAWVCDEVLPAIRKTGGYLTQQAQAKLDKGLGEARRHAARLYDENQALRHSLNLKKEEIIGLLKEQNSLLRERIKPKARPATTEEIHKILDLHASGKPIADIAALQDRSANSIRHILRKAREE